MVLLLQDCTIFGVSSLNNESRFPTIRLSSSNAMDYHCEIFVRTYSKPGGYLYALHAYIRPSSSTFPLAGAVANCTCPCGREYKMAASVKICDIDPEVIAKAKKFRMRKEQNIAALIFKIEPEKYLVVLDEEHENISIDDLRDELPSQQPRYVLLSYVLAHDDGRKSFPLCFIFISPQGCKPELQMMYSGSKKHLEKDIGATKIFELRSVEELTEEWLVEKLKFFR